MQPELHPAAEMEGDTWSTTRGKRTESFLIEGNKCFSDKEMLFCPSSYPIASQDRQRWRRTLDEAAAAWPRGSAGGAFQTSRGREGNPKNRTKGGGAGEGGGVREK